MTKKILVTGFPHSGTTILRAKIGECYSVFDQPREFGDAPSYNPNSEYEWYVWKHPFLHTVFRNGGFKVKPDTQFANTIVIPIIRNPWYVFTSLKKRGEQTGDFDINDNKQGHSLSYYFNAADIILDAFKNNYEGVYPIRYEDMFDNDYQKLKEIFDKIGLKYDDDIFTNKSKVYKHNESKFIENYSETEKYDNEYRAWQINQKFQNMNNQVNIPEDISQKLANDPATKELGYTDPRN